MNSIYLNKFGKYLLRPYPYQPKRWIVLILLPLFIALFIVVFQPFGLQGMRHEYKSLLLVGYGFVTLVVLGFNMYFLPWIFPKPFSESRWTILSEGLWLTWQILTIGVGNYLYSVYFNIAHWSGIYGLLIFVGFTFAIGIFPVVIMIFFSYNYWLRKNLAMAEEAAGLLAEKKKSAGKSGKITLYSENQQNQIQTTLQQLICIESESNYINAWCAEEGRIVKYVLRNTLKNIESQLSGFEGLFRCHRAFIINMRHVERADGNSQGYRVKLAFLDNMIPVSRNYTRLFNEALRRER